MSFNAPKLDDRTFQELVDEAKRRISLYTANWTDRNLSDPGITFIELFAWLTETILYRLNQVPDLHTIKFMELLGMKLQVPSPATVSVSFWLEAPQSKAVLIPAATEIISAEIEGEAPIVFSTERDFEIQSPQLNAVFSTKAANDGGKQLVSHKVRDLEAGGEAIELFTAVPQIDDALYFGFENDLSHHILQVTADFDPNDGAEINPTAPPYRWEAAQEKGWQACDVESDTTLGMNQAGEVTLHLPQLDPITLHGKKLWWVRVRIKEITPHEAEHQFMHPYHSSPQLKQLQVETVGGAVNAIHAQYVRREHLGRSDGMPGQTFQLQLKPVLNRQAGETLLVHDWGEREEAWQEVPDFSTSGEFDKHYTLDGVSGEIRFGPAIRQLDGTVRRYGASPPRGARLIFSQYRAGGNQDGNVAVGVLNRLPTPLPHVARIANRKKATGGLETETLESAMVRVPHLLRTRNRAVTVEDFEYLAKEANPARVGRAKCLAVAAEDERPSGKVNVLIVPQLPHLEPNGMTADMLSLAADDLAQIKAYLAERCLLTTRVKVGQPQYLWVSVMLELQIEPDQDFYIVQQWVLERLHRFLHPLTGGNEGQGWPFGRDLVAADVYQCLHGLPGVRYLRRLRLMVADNENASQWKPVEFVAVPENGLLVSGRHFVGLWDEQD